MDLPDLPKHSSCSECNQDFGTIGASKDLNFTLFDDVHLSANLSLGIQTHNPRFSSGFCC